MPEPRIEPSQPIGGKQLDALTQKYAEKAEALEVEMVVSSETEFEEWCAEGFNPVAMTRKFRPLDELRGRKSEKSEEKESVKKGVVEETRKIEEVLNRTQKQNPEFQKKALLALLASISEKDSPEEILKKVLEFYPDHTLADEALDFLMETSAPAIVPNVIQAKNILNTTFSREIKAGKNIAEQVKTYAQVGLASPSDLRKMYRDITGIARPANVLFDQLSQLFPFKKMKSVIDFMLHSLGSDIKSKGPSISRPELLRLLEETRSLQAILGVYRFFHSRMRLINAEFIRNDLSLPQIITFENLSQQFVKLLGERYPSPERIFQMGKILQLPDDILAQIVIFTQMRDAVRNVAPKLFRNEKHKQEVLKALIESLEELEEKLEEEEEEEEEEK